MRRWDGNGTSIIMILKYLNVWVTAHKSLLSELTNKYNSHSIITISIKVFRKEVFGEREIINKTALLKLAFVHGLMSSGSLNHYTDFFLNWATDKVGHCQSNPHGWWATDSNPGSSDSSLGLLVRACPACPEGHLNLNSAGSAKSNGERRSTTSEQRKQQNYIRVLLSLPKGKELYLFIYFNRKIILIVN